MIMWLIRKNHKNFLVNVLKHVLTQCYTYCVISSTLFLNQQNFFGMHFQISMRDSFHSAVCSTTNSHSFHLTKPWLTLNLQLIKLQLYSALVTSGGSFCCTWYLLLLKQSQSQQCSLCAIGKHCRCHSLD